MVHFTARQNEIINTSIKIIADSGIQHLTIKNIAKKIKISEPAIYRHFNSKTEILMAIISYFKNSNDMASDKFKLNSFSSIEKIEFVYLKHFNRFESNPALSAVIFSEEIFKNEDILLTEITSIMNSNKKMLINIITEGQKENEIRNDIPSEQLVMIIMGALRLCVTDWRISNFSFDIIEKGILLWASIKKIISR